MSRLLCVSSIAVLAFVLAGTASATIDPAASVVLVRKSCSGLDNCFEYLGRTASSPAGADAAGWIQATRKPTASTPLLVDIGPGTWMGLSVTCASGAVEGHITFRGAGQGTTKVADNLSGSPLFGTIVATGGCVELAFESMTILERGPVWLGFNGPVVWMGGGNSKWTNIEIISHGPRLWYDTCTMGESPEHYFFASKLTLFADSSDHQAVRAECGKTWFFGSEISVFGSVDTAAALFGSEVFAAIVITDIAESSQLFGSLVRVVQGAADPNDIAGGTIYGVKITSANSPAFHMHGGNMRVSASESTNAVGVDAGTTGTVHTPGSAFVIETEEGETTRLAGNPGNLQSPFLWPPGTEPPVDHSRTGADLFVETDCEPTGDCSGGDESHLMVYNSSACPAGPWFDTVTRRCRNDTTDPVADELADHEQRISDLEALH